MRLKRPLHGSESGADVRMVQRALNKAPSRTTIAVTGIYDETTQKRVRAFRMARSLSPGKHFDQAALDALWPYFDAYGRWRYRLYKVPPPKPSMPLIGPVVKDGVSLLDHRLTHKTSGIPLFPAFDTAFGSHVPIIAPENLRVDTKFTSAHPGKAFYATGDSRLRYWFAHLDRDWPLGTLLARGVFVGKTVPTTIGGGPHAHVGVNAEAYLGKGQQLKYGRTGYGPDYTFGSPTIRDQLVRALI